MLFASMIAGRKDVGTARDLSDAVGVYFLRRCTSPTIHKSALLYDKENMIITAL